jgi:hypothetical protein
MVPRVSKWQAGVWESIACCNAAQETNQNEAGPHRCFDAPAESTIERAKQINNRCAAPAGRGKRVIRQAGGPEGARCGTGGRRTPPTRKSATPLLKWPVAVEVGVEGPQPRARTYVRAGLWHVGNPPARTAFMGGQRR